MYICICMYIYIYIYVITIIMINYYCYAGNRAAYFVGAHIIL